MKKWTVTDTVGNGKFTVLRRGPNSELLDIDMGNEEDAYLAAAAPKMRDAINELLFHFGPNGDYAICLKNGEKIGFGDAIVIGDVFKNAQEVSKAAVPE